MNKKEGFTLVELLAVIVILAVILIIAVPQIMSVIESARKGSIESTAKLIAEGAEREYTNRKILGKDTNIECSEVANLNDKDYGTCSITFDNAGKATVKVTGKGKFEGYTCNGNSTNMECAKGESSEPTAAEYIRSLWLPSILEEDNTSDKNTRYVGTNPDNYVKFNDELWRIIGVFGDNIKIIRSESIGDLSWDSSSFSDNTGYGVNEWSVSDLKEYLNTMYYGGSTVTCYNEMNNATTTCPTASLNNSAKEMIDNHTWNIGAIEDATKTNTLSFYNAERGTSNGKMCTSGPLCYDTVERTTTWTGYVGLPYVTDWAYASGENVCETNMQDKDTTNDFYTCKGNNWMHYGGSSRDSIWTLSPVIDSEDATRVWTISGDGTINSGIASVALSVFPTVYLKSSVKITSGTGTSADPYILSN